MGRDARIKRERRRTSAELPPPPIDVIPSSGRSIITGPPLPGCEDAVADDGYFDDCPVCQALRAGDPERALEIMKAHPSYVEWGGLPD